LPEQDFKNIEAGVYKLPWDMTSLRNKQYDPLHVVRTALTFAAPHEGISRQGLAGLLYVSHLLPQHFPLSGNH